MAGNPLRKGREVFGGDLRVCPFDRRIEDFGPDAVAVPRLVSDVSGENEVVGFAPFGSDLMFAQEPHQLPLKGDLAKPCGGLGNRHPKDARLHPTWGTLVAIAEALNVTMVEVAERSMHG